MSFFHFFHQVYSWFTDGANWNGSDGVNIPVFFVHQVYISAVAIAVAVLLGGGFGLVLGHTGRGGLVAVNAANAFRAVPTLALLTLLAIWKVISTKSFGFPVGFPAAAIALVVLGIPPILTNTYVGIREVDPDVREAARAMGLTGRQVLGRVELPLALPFIMAGIRTSAIEIVATATLAAETGFSDLGTPVAAGLNTGDSVEAFCGAVLVVLTAALTAALFGFLLRLVRLPGAEGPRRGLGSLLPGAHRVAAAA